MNASSSVRSSPRKITPSAPTSCRRRLSAAPLSVSTSDSSSTILPLLALTPGSRPGPLSTSSTSTDASSGSTSRKWNATPAGLLSTIDPGARATISSSCRITSARLLRICSGARSRTRVRTRFRGSRRGGLRGEAAQRGEVPQRPARDHRDVRVGERGQRAQRDDRLAYRQRLSGVVDVPRNRAVVIAGDEQDRHRDDVVETGVRLLVVPFGVTRSRSA